MDAIGFAITFHSRERASVTLSHELHDFSRRWMEGALVAMFISRQLYSMGPSDAQRGIIKCLEALRDLPAAEIEPNLDHLADAELSPGDGLVVPAGAKGFSGSISSDGDLLYFQMQASGFGLLARGANYYAPEAILLLLQHLVSQTRDPDHQRRLAVAAAQMARYASRYGKAMMPFMQTSLSKGLVDELWDMTVSDRADDADTPVDADDGAAVWNLIDDLLEREVVTPRLMALLEAHDEALTTAKSVRAELQAVPDDDYFGVVKANERASEVLERLERIEAQLLEEARRAAAEHGITLST